MKSSQWKERNLLGYSSFLTMTHVAGVANYLLASNMSAFIITLLQKEVFNFLLTKIPI